MATTERFDVVGFIIDWENGETSPLETLEGFGHLIKDGTIKCLQGTYQRTAAALVAEGLIDPETGNITDLAVERLAALPESD